MKQPLILVALAIVIGSFAGGCATVRPEQRAVLADPIMQFENDTPDETQLQHVQDNREGSFGGGSVKGGGCGCN